MLCAQCGHDQSSHDLRTRGFPCLYSRCECKGLRLTAEDVACTGLASIIEPCRSCGAPRMDHDPLSGIPSKFCTGFKEPLHKPPLAEEFIRQPVPEVVPPLPVKAAEGDYMWRPPPRIIPPPTWTGTVDELREAIEEDRITMTPHERRALAGLPPLTDPWANVPPKPAEPVAVSKASDPKEAFSSNKLPLHLFPPSAIALGSLAFLQGAFKYGRGNWRAVGVRASTYFEALCRHLFAWWEGEDIDPDSGLPHLAHVLACGAILVDADAAGKLNDDRPYPGDYAALVATLVPHVARLKKAAEGLEEPEHFTRQSVFSKGKS